MSDHLFQRHISPEYQRFMDLVESVRPRPFSDPYTDDLNLTAKCSTQDLVANLKQLTNIPYPPPDMSEHGEAEGIQV